MARWIVRVLSSRGIAEGFLLHELSFEGFVEAPNRVARGRVDVDAFGGGENPRGVVAVTELDDGAVAEIGVLDGRDAAEIVVLVLDCVIDAVDGVIHAREKPAIRGRHRLVRVIDALAVRILWRAGRKRRRKATD